MNAHSHSPDKAPDALAALKAWLTARLNAARKAHGPLPDLRRLASAFKATRLTAGDVVFQQGEPGDQYYVMGVGSARVERGKAGVESPRVLAELQPGQGFGEESLLNGEGRNASVRMLTDGTLLTLERDAFMEDVARPLLHAVDLKEAIRTVARGGYWIDVESGRGVPALEGGRVLRIPLLHLRTVAPHLPRERPLIVCCDHGRLGATGAYLLAERGFPACYLGGGLERHGITRAPVVGVELEKPHLPPVAAPNQTTVAADAEIAEWLAQEEGLQRVDPATGRPLSQEAFLARQRAQQEHERQQEQAHNQRLLEELAEHLDPR